MTHTANKITDEPHLIEACSGGKFIVFDGLDCRITINGGGALDAAHEIKKCVNLHDELVGLIVKAREDFKAEYINRYGSTPYDTTYCETLKKAGAM